MQGRTTRLLVAVLIAGLLCVGATVEAQRRGGFGFSARIASPKDFDGLFHFCRVIFGNAGGAGFDDREAA